MSQWRRLVTTRERRPRAMGIRYRNVVAPETLMICDHRLDGLGIVPTASAGPRSPLRSLAPVGNLRLEHVRRLVVS
ncbi:hypothetical protein ACRAWG_13235 [Methylobacterium sp. P31]